MKSYYCPDCGAEIPVEDISYQVNGRSLPQIEISTPGEKKIMIAAGLKEDSLDYVAAQLRREVQRI